MRAVSITRQQEERREGGSVVSGNEGMALAAKLRDIESCSSVLSSLREL